MNGIGKNFHIIHMTDDLAALDRWYDDVFSVHRYMGPQFADLIKRHASLVLIGDLCIEPMQPSFEVEGWDSVAIGRFYQRFGTRWHSIAWYMDDDESTSALSRRLREHGVRLFGVAGNATEDDSSPRGGIFTHPKDTITQLEFMARPSQADQMRDPRFTDFDPAPWAAEHPLHLLNSSHVTLTVDDLGKALDVYLEGIGGTLLHECEMPLLSSRSAFVAVGDLVVELAQPLDAGTALGADHAAVGPALYSVSLRVRDLAEAEQYLTTKGFEFPVRGEQFLFSDPASSMGVVFGFTTWDIPGDVRPTWEPMS